MDIITVLGLGWVTNGVPQRVSPTVALTPVVAGWLGKKPVEDGNETETAE